MRIIAGRYKRRQLVTAEGTEITRPTADRVRESAFNIIAPELQGAIVLDLFAGSGALAIEAISRGAARAVAVERAPEALAALRANAAALGIDASTLHIVPTNVEAFLASPSTFLPPGFLQANVAASIDVVFADPPYEASWYDGAITLLEASGLFRAHALAVVEMAHGREMPAAPGSPWTREDDRKYGRTRVEFWRKG